MFSNSTKPWLESLFLTEIFTVSTLQENYGIFFYSHTNFRETKRREGHTRFQTKARIKFKKWIFPSKQSVPLFLQGQLGMSLIGASLSGLSCSVANFGIFSLNLVVIVLGDIYFQTWFGTNMTWPGLTFYCFCPQRASGAAMSSP